MSSSTYNDNVNVLIAFCAGIRRFKFWSYFEVKKECKKYVSINFIFVSCFSFICWLVKLFIPNKIPQSSAERINR